MIRAITQYSSNTGSLNFIKETDISVYCKKYFSSGVSKDRLNWCEDLCKLQNHSTGFLLRFYYE